jgi:cytochrome c biogenesis protein ResB
MKKALEALASPKFVVLLLVLLLLGLAAGTISESKLGPEGAQRAVYYAWWFLLLQAVFVASVVASLVQRFPWGKERIGFLVLHGSLVVVLAGAAITYFTKVQGQIGLWEGEAGSVFYDRTGPQVKAHTLPFTLKLLRYRTDYYPGTRRPSMFSSEVEIVDPAAGGTVQARIWMNHPLHHRGYSFFQSSYKPAELPGGPEASIFQVSKDPGQTVVFVGYALLVLGMCIVLFTRVIQARKKAALEAALGLGGKASATRRSSPG